jgi:flagellin-like protein
MITRKIRKDDEFGVSPVIAVILMVAITVVLAGVLYAWLQGITDVDSPTIQYSAVIQDKNTHWEIEIIGQSGGSLELDDAKFQINSRTGTVKLKTKISEANPISIKSGLSLVYPIPTNSANPVRENTTNGDGEPVDANSVDHPQVWEGCAIAYIDAEGDSKVNPGDIIWVFKDWDGDDSVDVIPGYSFKLIGSEDKAVLSKDL